MTAVLCVLVGGAGLAGVAAHDDEAGLAVDVGDDARPTSTTSVPTSTSSTTTTVAPAPVDTTTTTAAASAPPPATAPPPAPPTTAGTVAPEPPPAPAADATEAGLYVFEVSTGTLRRIAEPAPWDVAGGIVLLGRGLGVHAVGLDGTELGVRYVLPPSPVIASYSGGCCDLARERITAIEAAPDGAALVTALVPMHSGAGSMGATRVVSPTGQVFVEDHSGLDFEWSDDGRSLAVYTNDSLRLEDARGTFVRDLAPEFIHSFRWSPDGATVFGRAAQGPVLVDVAGGGTTPVSALSNVSDALGGGWFVGDGPWDHDAELAPLLLWNRTTGEVVTLAPRNGAAVASDDGARVAVLRSPYEPGFHGYRPANWSIEVLDRGGAVVGRVGVPAGLTVAAGGGPGLDGWPGPAWAGDGDHVVFTVVPSDQFRVPL